MEKMKSSYYYLSRYRTEIMGFAILWVVWFHSEVYLTVFPISTINVFFDFAKRIGYCGVDIFLLVSGMGIYQSLQKNNISTYIKNRAKKILPVWWSYLALIVILGLVLFGEIPLSKLEALGFASFTGFWCGLSNQGNWYVYAIVLFYLISPVLASLIKESKNKKTMCLILIAVLCAISFAYFGKFELIVFSRLPIYIIGMYFSAKLKEVEMNKKRWICCLGIFVASIVILFFIVFKLTDFLWAYGLWWYPFIIIAPVMSLCLAWCFDKLQKIKFISFFFKTLGKASLEILLISDYLFANYKKIGITATSELLTAIIVAVLSVILGILFHILIEKCKDICAKVFLMCKKPKAN